MARSLLKQNRTGEYRRDRELGTDGAGQEVDAGGMHEDVKPVTVHYKQTWFKHRKRIIRHVTGYYWIIHRYQIRFELN